MKRILYILFLIIIGISLIGCSPNNEKVEEDIVVAIIDTGIDYTHPDFKNHMWENETDLPGKYGYDFMNDDEDPADDFGHGTHCAGVVLNTAKDLGVDENLKFMAIKYMDENGSADIDRAIKAYEYIISAKEKGVNVVAINNSWGVDENPKELEDLIIKAGELGILSFNAAGNDGSNLDYSKTYPSGYKNPYSITVAATTENDELASFSVYGEGSVDIGAPGTGIIAPYYREYYIPEGNLEENLKWNLVEAKDEYYENNEIEYKNTLEYDINGNEEFFGIEYSYKGSTNNLAMLEGYSDGMWMNLGTFLLIEDNFPNTKVFELYEDLEKIRLVVPESEDGDEISILKMGVGKSTGKYAKLSGTSMATPNVIGSYLKILSENPDKDVAELKEILLSKVKPLKGDKLIRGNGIFDINEDFKPVIEKYENGKIIGSHFGDSGELLINDKKPEINSWNDKEIEFSLENLPLGESEVTIHKENSFDRSYKLYLKPKWEGYKSGPTLPEEITNGVGFYKNSNMYVLGGEIDKKPNRNIYMLNSLEDEFRKVGELSETESENLRIGGSVEIYNDKIYISGYNEINEETIIYNYDFNKNELIENEIKMPGSKNRTLLKEYNGNLYLIGGIERVDEEFVSTIWKYTEEKNEFERILFLDGERFSPLAYEEDGLLYILGGLYGENKPVNRIEVFDGKDIKTLEFTEDIGDSLKVKTVDDFYISDGVLFKNGIFSKGKLNFDNKPLGEEIRDYFTVVKGKTQIYILGGRKDLRPSNEMIYFNIEYYK